jgi:hypothetical protein
MIIARAQIVRTASGSDPVVAADRPTGDLETVLADYFAGARSTLDEVYTWKIPQFIPKDFGLFERGGDSNARANMRLRVFLSDAWRNEPSKRVDIAKWYVGVWGGINANKYETIERYVHLSEPQLASLGIYGVATWSKILAVRNPGTYPIFDARVSASLSAIQLANGVKSPILFPQVPSRNSRIATFQQWLNHRPSDTIMKLPRSRAYGEYVSLLGTVVKKLGLASPEEVEMVLFANAKILVDQILDAYYRGHA